MKITSKPLRILAMVGIGIVLALIFYAIGLPQKSIGPLTGGILFFIWPALGGSWW
ncbi:MAG: hypothetical protein UH084_07560 [Paludibacteraceae bacterium]|jgi:hypothetical protein|nr:hypothetical protein [Paludibacteraceae bacterium]